MSCGGSGFVRFWSTSRSCLLAEFIAHKDTGSIIMTVDRTCKYLITGDIDGCVKVWNIQVRMVYSLACLTYLNHEEHIILGQCIESKLN